jgi:lipopolysaccharide export system permease protein
MMIFLLQSVWVYISELAGKELEIVVILKFLLYVSPRIVALVLPLTILLASIMVFGGFSENYEFAAMKSTGISLQRAMKSLSMFIVFLAVISFFFANNVIPAAEYSFYNLRKNIAKVKPAMAIAEGQFNQLDGINIKVAEKSGENGSFLRDVIIHQKKGNSNVNNTVIKSNTGQFISNENSDILQLVLIDGNFYDELQPKNYIKRTKNKPQAKSTFDKYIINIDVSQFNDIDYEDKQSSKRYTMLGVRDLSTTIDSLNITKDKVLEGFSKKMLDRSNTQNLNIAYNVKEVDSIQKEFVILELFSEKKAIQLLDIALNSIKSAKDDLKIKSKSLLLSEVNINKHIISMHDKFVLGFSCIILFFIGAPLGALIRKGGIGLPLIIAILIFLTYHFIGLFAKNSAEDSSLDPVFATWLSTLIVLPFSIYLTNRATKDRALVDFDSILIPLINSVNNNKEVLTLASSSSENSDELERSSNEQLIDIVKNYRQFGLSYNYKSVALGHLKDRGISELELRMSGQLLNEKYETGIRHLTDFKENSKLAVVLYFVMVVFGLGGSILNNNGFPTVGPILIIVASIATILFLMLFKKTVMNQSNFYTLLKKNFMTNSVVFILLGLPLFVLYRIYFSKKMTEDLSKIT